MIKTVHSRQYTVHSNKGFTLVEMLLYLALFAGFLLVLTDIFVASLDVELESTAASSVANDGQYILTRLMYDAGQAQDITQPLSLGQQTSTLILVLGGQSYTYAVSNGTLALTNNVGTSTLNNYGTTVSGFTAKKIGNVGGKPTVQVQFILTSTTTRSFGPEIETFNTTLGVR